MCKVNRIGGGEMSPWQGLRDKRGRRVRQYQSRSRSSVEESRARLRAGPVLTRGRQRGRLQGRDVCPLL